MYSIYSISFVSSLADYNIQLKLLSMISACSLETEHVMINLLGKSILLINLVRFYVMW